MRGGVINGKDACPVCGHKYYYHHSKLYNAEKKRDSAGPLRDGCRVYCRKLGVNCGCTDHKGKRMVRMRTYKYRGRGA